MIATKILGGAAIGGTAAGLAALLLSDDPTAKTDGVFALLSAVVLGVGGGMLKIGWELVKTNRRIAVVLADLNDRQKDDRQSNDAERDRAVNTVREEIRATRESVMDELARAREEVRRLLQKGRKA